MGSILLCVKFWQNTAPRIEIRGLLGSRKIKQTIDVIALFKYE